MHSTSAYRAWQRLARMQLGSRLFSAAHGAVTIEQARLGQTRNAAASYELMLDLLIAGLSAAGPG